MSRRTDLAARGLGAALWRKRLGRRRIAVLMGGVSAEREISLRSGRRVLAALREGGANAYGVDLRAWRDLVALERRRPALAWICLHGTLGEDGAIQGVLEWMGIPYTGSGVAASALAMDKARSKELFRFLGLPTPDWAWLRDPSDPVPATPRPPVVVKPNRQGSTVGITIVRRPGDLAAAVRRAFRHDTEVLVEKYCAGMEITIGILGDQALPIIEIVPKTEFYDYTAKYSPGMSEHIIPARLAPGVRDRAQRIALAAHRALGCRAVSRVDLIVGARGELNLLEVNTIPGMTGTSLLPDAARQVGISFPELVLRLAALALPRRS
jgi:D-alanine-D-alanine ligase